MARLEFGDLYKFIASLGAVILALSLILPWLLLRESLDVGISNVDFGNLTPTAQSLISYRQQTALWMIQNLWWISTVVGAAGAIIMGTGVYLWRRQQHILDEKLGYEKDEVRQKLEKMSANQVVAKAEEKVSSGTETNHALGTVDPKLNTPKKNEVNEYLATEVLVAQKLEQCFKDTHKVLTNEKIADKRFDIILQGKRTRHNDAIVEIRIARQKLTPYDVINAIMRFELPVQDYDTWTGREANPIILFLFTDLANRGNIANDYEEIIQKDHVPVMGFVETYFDSIDNFLALDCDTLWNIMFPKA